MSLLRLVPAVAFRTLPGFVHNILGLRLDCRDLLDILLLVLHMLVAMLHHLLLHMLVEGWLYTLLGVAPPVSRVVGHTLARLVRTQPAVVLLAQLVLLAMPLASLGLVAGVLGVL